MCFNESNTKTKNHKEAISMDSIIQQISENFIKNILNIFENKRIDINFIENDFLNEAKTFAIKATQAYIEQIDKEIIDNKKLRKELDFIVERKNDKREIETKIGTISFNRTYFLNKKSNEYMYLADQVVGLESYTRVSDGLSLSLVEAAQNMSYQKSSELLTGGKVTRQTVMHKIRKSSPIEQKFDIKKKIDILHIDADEAHVTLISGKNTIVPLISIYEGIEYKGKRGKCKNIFHISEYGKSPDELWEQALNEIEKRYDITNAKIYLHGDGASWIKTGFEWLPNAVFVLDKYHKNKEIKSMTAGLDKETRKSFDKEIRDCLEKEDVQFFKQLTGSLMYQMPEREDKIKLSSKYLISNVKGISICKNDIEANNGGCTEPHVSHVLANRLSTRPMAWGKTTLKRLSPILANPTNITLDKKETVVSVNNINNKTRRIINKKIKVINNKFQLPYPNQLGNITAISSGKVTPLYSIIKHFAKS